MVDVDYFKNYNDIHGHLAGDSCLQKIARTIRDSLSRAGNFAARYGGEEFAVILPDTDAEGAYLLIESLREKIANLNIDHSNSRAGKNVTVSMLPLLCLKWKVTMMNSYPWLIRPSTKQSREDEIV
jgi:diguanylate cyclase (GGDEF)-like protein